MNNLIDKGNFKKQNHCLWTEGGGGASLDSGVKQNWQKSSVNFLPISVIYYAHMSPCSFLKWCEVSLPPALSRYPAARPIYSNFSHRFF